MRPLLDRTVRSPVTSVSASLPELLCSSQSLGQMQEMRILRGLDLSAGGLRERPSPASAAPPLRGHGRGPGAERHGDHRGRGPGPRLSAAQHSDAAARHAPRGASEAVVLGGTKGSAAA